MGPEKEVILLGLSLHRKIVSNNGERFIGQNLTYHGKAIPNTYLMVTQIIINTHVKVFLNIYLQLMSFPLLL